MAPPAPERFTQTISRPPSAMPMMRRSSYQGFAVSSAENRDASRRRSAAAKMLDRSVNVAGTSHLIDGQAQHIGPGTTDHRFEFGCEKLYVTAKALQRSRHGDAQEIAVGEHPSHSDRDQNERHHADGQPRGKLHGPAPGTSSQE